MKNKLIKYNIFKLNLFINVCVFILNHREKGTGERIEWLATSLAVPVNADDPFRLEKKKIMFTQYNQLCGNWHQN